MSFLVVLMLILCTRVTVIFFVHLVTRNGFRLFGAAIECTRTATLLIQLAYFSKTGCLCALYRIRDCLVMV